ncbi:unnamed protein product [Pieris macdunnoughi]|uniref:Uncharacterized protein n=1 Tax=Pieris macdunnoughi TaxID=345717 RepID=A0A821XIX8_9NEOP|nr:unnamed protein product [Pieris macdunnoughi]
MTPRQLNSVAIIGIGIPGVKQPSPKLGCPNNPFIIILGMPKPAIPMPKPFIGILDIPSPPIFEQPQPPGYMDGIFVEVSHTVVVGGFIGSILNGACELSQTVVEGIFGSEYMELLSQTVVDGVSSCGLEVSQTVVLGPKMPLPGKL